MSCIGYVKKFHRRAHERPQESRLDPSGDQWTPTTDNFRIGQWPENLATKPNSTWHLQDPTLSRGPRPPRPAQQSVGRFLVVNASDFGQALPSTTAQLFNRLEEDFPHLTKSRVKGPAPYKIHRHRIKCVNRPTRPSEYPKSFPVHRATKPCKE